jgi:hypothetical protein
VQEELDDPRTITMEMALQGRGGKQSRQPLSNMQLWIATPLRGRR